MNEKVRKALRIAGAAVLAAGIALLSLDVMAGARYEALGNDVVHPAVMKGDGTGGGDDGGQGGSGTQVDWDELLAQNADVVAWLEVDGTAVSHPVVRCTPDRGPEWYLNHDLWGNYAFQGTAFLDPECSHLEGVQLVYGHHFSYTSLMFSDLHDCYRQESFDQLGELRWTTREQGTWHLSPVCSMMVDSSDEEVRKVSFGGVGGLQRHAASLCARADAVAEGWKERCADCTHVVALVTCSSLLANQPWRTVTVFAG